MPVSSPDKIILRAGSYVGNREDPPGSNNGAFVRVCQSHTWLKVPLPGQQGWAWCVAFIQRVFDEAGFPWPWKTAGARDLYDRAAREGWVVHAPEPGDVAIWPFGDWHASVVKAVAGANVTTIDGNWGDAVAVVTRPISQARGFVRHPGFAGRPTPPSTKPPLFQVVGGVSGARRVVFRGPRSAVGKWVARTAIGRRFPAGVTIRRAK